MQIIPHNLDLDEVQVLENLLSRSSDTDQGQKFENIVVQGLNLRDPFLTKNIPKSAKTQDLLQHMKNYNNITQI